MHLDWSSIDTRQFQASLNAEMNTCVNITTVGFLGCRRQLFLFLCSAIRGVDSALVGGYGMNDFEGLLNLGPGFRRLSSTNIAADGVSCHIHHVMYITMFKTFTILCRLEHQLSINFASSVIRCKWMFGFEKCSHSYVWHGMQCYEMRDSINRDRKSFNDNSSVTFWLTKMGCHTPECTVD
jgi:hypothetical protein